MFLRQKLYINDTVIIITATSLITLVTFQLYNNKDLLKTTRCTITKTCRVLIHSIVESRDRQCKLRTRQHLTKLPLASAPLTVERESKKRTILVSCFTFHAAPLTVKIESKRGISTSHGHEHVHFCIG